MFIYVNGDLYVGTFRQGAYNGCGTYYYANGDRYSGDYKNNQFHGVGTYYEADGSASTYHYLDGTIVGEGVQSAVADATNTGKPITRPVAEPKPTVQPEHQGHDHAQPETKPAAVTTEPSPVHASTEPMNCPVCHGKGKVYQSEVRKNKMVTRDISNGLGPRNFVTYTVNEVVRPAGNVSCGRCGGSGKITQ